MVGIEFFKEEETGNLLSVPQFSSVEEVEKLVNLGKPESVVRKFCGFVANEHNWKILFDYQTKVSNYENSLAEYEADQERIATMSLEEIQEHQAVEEPLPVPALEFEPRTEEFYYGLVQGKAWEKSRRDAYGELGEQLDMIYKDIDSWKAHITAVKEKFPKPE